jgi:hypothetical protein
VLPPAFQKSDSVTLELETLRVVPSDHAGTVFQLTVPADPAVPKTGFSAAYLRALRVAVAGEGAAVGFTLHGSVLYSSIHEKDRLRVFP